MPSWLKWSLLVAAAMGPGRAEAGWPFSSDGPPRGSAEWYEARACEPIGQRQTYKFGKIWPARPRPVGEHAPLIHKYHHNLYWPYPYKCMDQESVNQFIELQIVNGWEEATTLYDYHFESESHELNRAGRDHLYWIMSSVPVEFRTAYVQASRLDPSVSQMRIAAVQSEASRFVGADQVPPVLLRVTTPHGTPAAEVDAVFQYRRANLTPSPVLQGAALGGGEGGGGN